MSALPIPFNITAPGANLEAYVRTVNGISVLSAEEERLLADRLHQEGDVDAARRLVLANLRFVIYIARSYSGYGLSEADLIQEGNVGLMKAVKRFNPEYQVRLVSLPCTGSKPRSMSLSCVTGVSLKSPLPKRSANYFSICAARKKIWLG